MLRGGCRRLEPLRVSQLVKRNISSGTDAMITSKVHFSVQDSARVATLNRSKKLNALDTEMCSSISNTLTEYAKSDAAKSVLLNSSIQPRAFCAGGDVAGVAQSNLSGNVEDSMKFFETEYSMNLLMATYRKPIVVFMDGITMGGGVGLSIHAPFRVATENTKWAMPESDIGFFPDVGVTFALPQLITLANKNSQMALYLCLTGEVLNGEDAYMLGLASHYVPSSNLPELQKRIGELHSITIANGDVRQFDMVNGAIEEFSTNLPSGYKFGYTEKQLKVIEKCFNIHENKDISSIMKKLESVTSDEQSVAFATKVKATLMKKSSTSLQVTLKLMQENSKDNIESALKRDLFTAANMCNPSNELSEFTKGVKHKLIDKIKTPYQWKQNKQLSSSQLVSLVSPKPAFMVSLTKDLDSVTWKKYPHHLKYQLPTETTVENFVNSAKNNQDQISRPINQKDLINHFSNINKTTRGKPSIELLCNLIWNRRELTSKL